MKELYGFFLVTLEESMSNRKERGWLKSKNALNSYEELKMIMKEEEEKKTLSAST